MEPRTSPETPDDVVASPPQTVVVHDELGNPVGARVTAAPQDEEPT